MALERLEILPIDDHNILEALREFNLDNAHCFDPNEEYKLRQIIRDIDGGSYSFEDSRFKQSLKKIADEIEKKHRLHERHDFYTTPIRWMCGLFADTASKSALIRPSSKASKEKEIEI